MRKTWNIIKGIINKNRVIKTQNKFKLNDNTIIADPKIVCNKFNDFFVNVGPSLAAKIPKLDLNPEQFMGNRLVNSMYIEPVNEVEIRKLINQLKDNSPGYDGVKASILKLSNNVLCTHITYLCSLKPRQ